MIRQEAPPHLLLCDNSVKSLNHWHAAAASAAAAALAAPHVGHPDQEEGRDEEEERDKGGDRKERNKSLNPLSGQ